MVPLNTRSKKREAVQSVVVEYSIDPATNAQLMASLPKELIRPDAGAIKVGLVDISAGGCGIESSYILPPGVLLQLSIDAALFASEAGVEHKDPIRCVGKVRSCVMKSTGHYRLGVQFSSVKKEDVELISSFIVCKERRKDQRWEIKK